MEIPQVTGDFEVHKVYADRRENPILKALGEVMEEHRRTTGREPLSGESPTKNAPNDPSSSGGPPSQ